MQKKQFLGRKNLKKKFYKKKIKSVYNEKKILQIQVTINESMQEKKLKKKLQQKKAMRKRKILVKLETLVGYCSDNVFVVSVCVCVCLGHKDWSISK